MTTTFKLFRTTRGRRAFLFGVCVASSIGTPSMPAAAGTGGDFCLEMLDEWFQCRQEAAHWYGTLSCPLSRARVYAMFSDMEKDVSKADLKAQIQSAYKIWNDISKQILRREDRNPGVDHAIAQLSQLVAECQLLRSVDDAE